MSTTYALGPNQQGQMIFFILSKDGWKIKNMATRQEVCISDSQLALAHQIVKPK